MATLIERLPSLRRTGDDDREHPMTTTTTKGGAPAGAHRLDSPPPSPDTTIQLEEDVTVQEDAKLAKGKGVDPRERGGSSSTSEGELGDGEGEGEAEGDDPRKRYPPMNDDEVEAKRVEEVCSLVPLLIGV